MNRNRKAKSRKDENGKIIYTYLSPNTNSDNSRSTSAVYGVVDYDFIPEYELSDWEGIQAEEAEKVVYDGNKNIRFKLTPREIKHDITQ